MGPTWKLRFCLVMVAAIGLAPGPISAGDIKISLPRHSALTPVQRLNREGVEATRKHNYDKAADLFYRAYLYDPGDPFTLNNLGYISELQGRFERARKFYSLAEQQASDAMIDRANSSRLQGKPMRAALGNIQDADLEINRANVEAISLLSAKRAPEAEALLRKTLTLSPQNPFTLNNLGVALEEEGDLDNALSYYTQAAQAHSTEPVIVTRSQSWKGKPVSEMAAESAQRLRKRMQSESNQTRSAQLNLHGVLAINHNDWQAADRDFRQAYALDPNNAFSLNNIGYLAEKYGDQETAQDFYERAQKAESARARVGAATRPSAEGVKLFAVADESYQEIDQQMAKQRETKRKQSAPIQLKRRDQKTSTPPEAIPPPSRP